MKIVDWLNHEMIENINTRVEHLNKQDNFVFFKTNHYNQQNI